VELYDLTGLLRGIGDTNPYVQPGDIVTVPGAGVVYIVGNVLQPQSLLLKTPITVRQAIAMVGGVLKDSLTDRVFICRSSLHSVEATLITVDLKAIKNGRAEDIALQPYDIVEVRGKRKNYPATPLYKKIILPEEKELPLRIIN
jgi:protein involved in polysaccharide export with SLBB domain